MRWQLLFKLRDLGAGAPIRSRFSTAGVVDI
jgi:hypothetical protein